MGRRHEAEAETVDVTELDNTASATVSEIRTRQPRPKLTKQTAGRMILRVIDRCNPEDVAGVLDAVKAFVG